MSISESIKEKLSENGMRVEMDYRDDVFIIFIKARGIDKIELKIKKATTTALTCNFNKLLIPNFYNVIDN